MAAVVEATTASVARGATWSSDPSMSTANPASETGGMPFALFTGAAGSCEDGWCVCDGR